MNFLTLNKTLLFCLFWIFLSPLFAQVGYVEMKKVDAFKNSLSETASSTNSIQSDFNQEKHLSIFKDPVESKGTLHYKKPDKVVWAYTTPLNYKVIINGSTICINDNGKKSTFEVSASNKFSQLNQLLFNAIQGNLLDDKNFTINYFEGEQFFLVKLSPKDKELSNFVSELHLFLNKSDYQVGKIELFESESDYTLIEFSNKTVNTDISDALFKVE